MKPTVLSPAILHMLLAPGRSDGKALMKFSLLDLVYRQILTVYPDPSRGSGLGAMMVSIGPKREAFEPTPFQAPFLALFHDADDLIPLTEVVAFACSRSKGINTFKRQRIAAYLHECGWLRRPSLSALNVYWHTAEGKAQKLKYQNWLEKADQMWQHLTTSPHPELGGFFRCMGAHIVLLPSFSEESALQLLHNSQTLTAHSNQYALNYGRAFLKTCLEAQLFGDWLDEALSLSLQKLEHAPATPAEWRMAS